MEKVIFYTADRPFSFSGKRKLKEFIRYVFKSEKKDFDHLSYIFCSDRYLLKINQDYLKHDYYTDIITFNLSDTNTIMGEVYISTDRVKDNAQTEKISYRDELLRVVIHGVLHLCGYSDTTKSEISEMRSREDAYLRLFTKMNQDG